MKKISSLAILGIFVAIFALIGSSVFADTNSARGQMMGWGRGGMGKAPGVAGTITSINGGTLVVTSRPKPNESSGTAYTVNASNATVTKNGSASSVSNLSVGDDVVVVGTVSGTNITATSIRDGMMNGGRMMNGGGMMPGVFGTVASISGNTLTVTSKFGPQGGTATTYTVDATNAKVTKNGASSSISSIAVGDSVMVQGTVNGTSVVATIINDGALKTPMMPKQNSPIVQGNGQPIIGGKVSAINGNTLTVTNTSNVTYTIDATNAFVEKGNATSSVSSIAVGDNVIVQGTVEGSSVTASSVIDGGALNNAQNNQMATHTEKKGGFGGFMDSVGGFFHRVFGFF